MNIMWIDMNGVNTLLNTEEIREFRMWEDGTAEITWKNGDKQTMFSANMAKKAYERIKNLSTIFVKEEQNAKNSMLEMLGCL